MAGPGFPGPGDDPCPPSPFPASRAPFLARALARPLLEAGSLASPAPSAPAASSPLWPSLPLPPSQEDAPDCLGPILRVHTDLSASQPSSSVISATDCHITGPRSQGVARLGGVVQPPTPSMPTLPGAHRLLFTELPEQTTLFSDQASYESGGIHRTRKATPAEPGPGRPPISETLCPVAEFGNPFFSLTVLVEQQKVLFSASLSNLVSQR